MCIFFVKPYVYWATGEWQAWTEEERESRALGWQEEEAVVLTVFGQNTRPAFTSLGLPPTSA